MQPRTAMWRVKLVPVHASPLRGIACTGKGVGAAELNLGGFQCRLQRLSERLTRHGGPGDEVDIRALRLPGLRCAATG